MTTIYDVAKAAGVSTATVSRAINEKPGVAPKTKKLVQDTARSLGWQPNVIAQTLAKR